VTFNFTLTLELLSYAQIFDKYPGHAESMSSDHVVMYTARNYISDMSEISVSTNGGSLLLPSNFSHVLPSVSSSEYLDMTVAVVDTMIYDNPETGHHPLADGGVMPDLYGVFLPRVSRDGQQFSLRSPKETQLFQITLQSSTGFDTAYSMWKRIDTCYEYNQVIEFDCPLGITNYTCDAQWDKESEFKKNGGGVCFVEYFCPGLIIPSCIFWNDTENDWSSQGCSVVNYTNINVTCECTHLSDFTLGSNVTLGSATLWFTNQPTEVPTSQPSSVPTAQPTGLPTGLPTRYPTSIPTHYPTSIPSATPSFPPPSEGHDLRLWHRVTSDTPICEVGCNSMP
jgi:hypothetical protein